MTIAGSRTFQLFKYAVYAFLTLNVYIFYTEEVAAVASQYPEGIGLHNLREAFSATIDTAAWVILLLMFELETYVLHERHFTKPVVLTLHGLRALCYIAILLAFDGYVEDMRFVSDVVALTGVPDLCNLPAGAWSWAITFGEYVPITAANCQSLSDATAFVQFRDLPVIVDSAGHLEIVRLAWVDVINAAVWILVVVVLEVDVRLQEHNRFEGIALWVSNVTKVVLYTTLLLAAVYWGVKGDFIDFWDAFLWLVAFVFIELNVFEWRAEEHAALAGTAET